MKWAVWWALVLTPWLEAECVAGDPSLRWAPLRGKEVTFRRDEIFHGYSGEFQAPIQDGAFTAYGIRIEVDESEYRVLGSKALSSIKRFPALIELHTDQGTRTVVVHRYGTRFYWSSHWGFRFKVGREPFALIDADADGKIGEVGEDFVVTAQSLVASRFVGEVWTRTGSWLVRRNPKGAGLQAARCPGFRPRKHPLTQAWCLLQATRMAAGCCPLAWDEERATSATKHARYLVLNNPRPTLSQKDPHEEEPGRPGYSEEGHTAGQAGIISFNNTSPLDHVREHIGTVYHLEDLLDHGHSAGAIGVHKEIGVISFHSSLGTTYSFWPHGPVVWVWPPHGAQQVPQSFNGKGEVPMPIPGKEGEWRTRIGQCIMAKLSGYSSARCDLRVFPRRRSRKPEATPVPGWMTSPSQPIGRLPTNDGLVVLAPQAPLPGNTVFECQLRIETEHEGTFRYTWNFRTR
ncbi:MAG: CAP domain-containing protein [Planctomycetota bacterium]|jgi:hypothetical protein